MSSKDGIKSDSHLLRQYARGQLPPTSPKGVVEPSLPVRFPTAQSKYLINDIPRGTKMLQLVNYLLAPPHWRSGGTTVPSKLHPHVQFGCIITDSRLDDSLSVARVHFIDTPTWLRRLNLDPDGFPKKTPLGTIWRAVDSSVCDAEGRTEFLRAAAADNLLYAEALAEFSDTDVNVQDIHGRTALHWAAAKNLPNIVMLCLSVPGCDVSLRDQDGLTAFDIARQNKDDRIPDLFYKSILELDSTDRPAALLRILTITSEPDESRPVFPGSEMFEPVESGNETLVAALIHRRVNLTARNADGDTALIVAASKVGGAVIAKRLLEAGSDVHATGRGGATALHHAARTADEQTVKLLLDWQADPAAEDTDDQTALHWAAENGQLDNARILLVRGADAQTRNKAGRTAQQVAEVNQKQDLVELLKSVNAGDSGFFKPVGNIDQSVGEETEKREIILPLPADIEMRGDRGRTALLQAAKGGDLDVVLALLALGASLHARDHYLHTALHLAAKRGYTEIVKELLAKGANIEAVDRDSQTALHFSAIKEHTETVKELLAKGANIEAVDWGNKTALHCSAASGHTEIVKVLLAKGANIEAVSHGGMTALHYSASRGHTKTVTELLAKGANIKTKDKDGWTALHFSAADGQTETVTELLAKGADLKAVDKKGMTALHFSAGYGHPKTVTELLAKGADIKAVSNTGRMPLHMVRTRETAEILLQHGAPIEARCRWGTALQMALGRDDTDMVDILTSHGAQTISAGVLEYRMLYKLGLTN